MHSLKQALTILSGNIKTLSTLTIEEKEDIWNLICKSTLLFMIDLIIIKFYLFLILDDFLNSKQIVNKMIPIMTELNHIPIRIYIHNLPLIQKSIEIFQDEIIDSEIVQRKKTIIDLKYDIIYSVNELSNKY